jgi:ATP-binding cassette, subfamily G (WHITE), member 2
MIGLAAELPRFAIFVITVVLLNVVASAACFLIGSITHSAGQANLVAVCFFVFCTIFGGLFLNEDGSALGPTVAYLKFASFFHYAYDVITNNS